MTKIYPGDRVIVTEGGSPPIQTLPPRGADPVALMGGFIGVALLPTDDGTGWVVDISPFGEAEVPCEWVMRAGRRM